MGGSEKKTPNFLKGPKKPKRGKKKSGSQQKTKGKEKKKGFFLTHPKREGPGEDWKVKIPKI